ncbi:TPA: DedA family protein [Clostridium botulinum]|uniref:DedA family protein n=1 Tax=Clostridium botulinum TaxID=1491 RepID=UPI000D0CB37E|nr:DedA family protein [Clostridium botulinum]PSL96620.1 DedA family protein [Clostridium botulinum]HDK7139634.1 DedA family protein [Clostridium botulinum]HDK7143218.1 DedA family protein [Clostridium botulinum]HDK7146614.1 DedA family protein [Clostridium botulinum]HDK7150318.1 DedA family protein [Clostridium botulinum]
MSIIGNFINALLHLDKYLNVIIQNYGMWTYALIFLIIFCETGLVITPFLPGDSILFAAGALAATGSFKIAILFVVLYLAAVIGDTVNYHIGKKIGTKILEKEDVKYLNKEYLKKAHTFYERHGSMTIVVGRFIPIIRTFVPFVAGIGEMSYLKFIIYNVLGGLLWVTLFLGGGYLFGNLPFIKQHLSYVVIAIIIISIIPVAVTFIREKRNGGKKE